MATNIKHTKSEKYNKALTLEDRNNIANIIASNRNPDGSLNIKLNDIAKILQKDPTTISKEIRKHKSNFKFKPYDYLFTNKFCKRCALAETCTIKETLDGHRGPCKDFQQRYCKYTLKFPYVCNGCQKRGVCTLPQTYYHPLNAQNEYRYTLTDSREGSIFTTSEFLPINKVITDGLKKGQSIEHIIYSNNLPISTKTAYIYLRKGYFDANLLDTHRMMRFKTKTRKKPEKSKIMRERKAGHFYEDYLKHLAEHPEQILSQWDTVEGTKGGKVILSMMIPIISFQFYFLLESKTAACVVNKLNEIENTIGIEAFKVLFGFALTDNGAEFSDVEGIIFNQKTGELRTNLFFCHPMRSDEKGSCERNHEVFRYVFPKGTSFDNLTQEDINIVTSNVNSLKRKSTNFLSPIEKFCAIFGQDILNKLNIFLIEGNQVNLKPYKK